MNNFWFWKNYPIFFYSSLIDQSEEESKKPKIEENHQTTTHPDTHPDPQLPSDEDMEGGFQLLDLIIQAFLDFRGFDFRDFSIYRGL